MNSSAIIIGSGLGGLSCGILLAQSGFRVTILEQNVSPGGCLQSFRRGQARFDTGMHYLGSAAPGETLHALFSRLGIAGAVPISPLDARGYDVVSLDKQRYAFAAGHDAFVAELLKSFPGEEAALRRYVSLVKEAAEAASLQHAQETVQSERLARFSQTSLDEMLCNLTRNARLRNVLAARLPLIAATRSRTPFLLHALITDFYAHGPSRIVGGGQTLLNVLLQRFKTLGGTLLTGQRVTEITTDSRGVTGVTTAEGLHCAARLVVSDAAPAVTLSLLHTPLLRQAFRKRIGALPQTAGCFTLYLEFEPDSVPYLPYNFYGYLSQTPWDCEQYTAADWPRCYLYMQAAECVRPRFAHTAEVISYMRWDEVAPWSHTSVNHRGTDYEAFKQQRAQRLLAALERDFPGTTASVAHYYTSTPLTYRDYTSTPCGSMYGVAADCQAGIAGRIPVRWRVPGLFQTGQNVNSHGLQGTLVGALQTCDAIMATV